jgi:hypothetical protein
MKIFTAILAILILFLTVQPAVSHLSFSVQKENEITAHKCCPGKQKIHSSKHNPQQEKNNNCCNNGHCNPLLPCAYCYFIVLDKPVFSNPFFLKQTENLRLVNDKILSSYIQDFWHPPESSLA